MRRIQLIVRIWWRKVRHRPSYREIIAAMKPTGYWPLDETSGTVARDLSGYGKDGAYAQVRSRDE